MAKAGDVTILVVDDEADVREYLTACLEDHGFKVETAVNGEDALEKMELRVPDLVTLDLVMPGISGVRVLRRMRRSPKLAEVPVILITAFAHHSDICGEIRELMAVPIKYRPRKLMEKPITPQKLATAIADTLNVDMLVTLGDSHTDFDVTGV